MATRRRSSIPRWAPPIVQQCARLLKKAAGSAFQNNPELKHAIGRLLVAVLPPHPARQGRPCEPHITRGAMLENRYRKLRPAESAELRWNRICQILTPGFKDLPIREQASHKAKLKASVRSRRNARRRRRRNNRPGDVSPPKQ